MYLLSLGANILQGYYFGKPVSLTVLPAEITACEEKLKGLSMEVGANNKALAKVATLPIHKINA